MNNINVRREIAYPFIEKKNETRSDPTIPILSANNEEGKRVAPLDPSCYIYDVRDYYGDDRNVTRRNRVYKKRHESVKKKCRKGKGRKGKFDSTKGYPGEGPYFKCQSKDCFLPHFHPKKRTALKGAARRLAEKKKSYKPTEYQSCNLITCRDHFHDFITEMTRELPELVEEKEDHWQFEDYKNEVSEMDEPSGEEEILEDVTKLESDGGSSEVSESVLVENFHLERKYIDESDTDTSVIENKEESSILENPSIIEEEEPVPLEIINPPPDEEEVQEQKPEDTPILPEEEEKERIKVETVWLLMSGSAPSCRPLSRRILYALLSLVWREEEGVLDNSLVDCDEKEVKTHEKGRKWKFFCKKGFYKKDKSVDLFTRVMSFYPVAREGKILSDIFHEGCCHPDLAARKFLIENQMSEPSLQAISYHVTKEFSARKIPSSYKFQLENTVIALHNYHVCRTLRLRRALLEVSPRPDFRLRRPWYKIYRNRVSIDLV